MADQEEQEKEKEEVEVVEQEVAVEEFEEVDVAEVQGAASSEQEMEVEQALEQVLEQEIEKVVLQEEMEKVLAGTEQIEVVEISPPFEGEEQQQQDQEQLEEAIQELQQEAILLEAVEKAEEVIKEEIVEEAIEEAIEQGIVKDAADEEMMREAVEEAIKDEAVEEAIREEAIKEVEQVVEQELIREVVEAIDAIEEAAKEEIIIEAIEEAIKEELVNEAIEEAIKEEHAEEAAEEAAKEAEAAKEQEAPAPVEAVQEEQVESIFVEQEEIPAKVEETVAPKEEEVVEPKVETEVIPPAAEAQAEEHAAVVEEAEAPKEEVAPVDEIVVVEAPKEEEEAPKAEEVSTKEEDDLVPPTEESATSDDLSAPQRVLRQVTSLSSSEDSDESPKAEDKGGLVSSIKGKFESPGGVSDAASTQSKTPEDTKHITTNVKSMLSRFDSPSPSTVSPKSIDVAADTAVISTSVKERMEVFNKSPSTSPTKTASATASPVSNVKQMTAVFSSKEQSEGSPSTSEEIKARVAADTSVISTSVKDMMGVFSKASSGADDTKKPSTPPKREKATVDPAGLEEFKEVKNNHKYKYLIYGIEGSTIKLLDTGASDATSKELVSKLNDNECRYCVLDHVFDKVDQYGKRQGSKLFFITWVPVTCAVQQKMLYSSERSSLASCLSGITEITCGSKDEILDALGEAD